MGTAGAAEDGCGGERSTRDGQAIGRGRRSACGKWDGVAAAVLAVNEVLEVREDDIVEGQLARIVFVGAEKVFLDIVEGPHLHARRHIGDRWAKVDNVEVRAARTRLADGVAALERPGPHID